MVSPRASSLLLVASLAGCLSASSPALADPFSQQGPKLTAEGELGKGDFGACVALSADGKTAVVGAPREDELRGAAWIFTRSGSTWTQSAKLTGGEAELGGSLDGVAFGASVAISADGGTVLVGGFGDDTNIGAAWVFSEQGGVWQQQGPKLVAGEETEEGELGRSVALSADGGTALVGGTDDGKEAGAAWVFAREGSSWAQQGAKLTGGGEMGRGRFGGSVGLSADGATALVGGRSDHGRTGAAWVFAREGTTWTQQGEKLTGGGETNNGEFASSVALSGDGATALVGGSSDEATAGAAWVFAREGATWTQQGEKLTSAEPAEFERFGAGVALSEDGDTALVGAYGAAEEVGAAWLLRREGTSWTQPGEKLTGGEEAGQAAFGLQVALAGDGHTALIGGPDDEGGCCAGLGAAWAFSDGLSEPPPEEIAPGGSEPGLLGGPLTGGGNSASSANAPPAGVSRPGAKHGLGTASSSSSRLARLFALALRPTGKNARIGALLRHGGLAAPLRAFAPGKAAIYWYKTTRVLAGTGAGSAAPPKARTVLVAAGKIYFKAAGKAGIEVRLTRAGRRLLRHAKQVQLTAKGTFTPNGASAVVAVRGFSLVR